MIKSIVLLFFVAYIHRYNCLLQIDCVSQQLQLSECKDYITGYFQSYTGNLKTPFPGSVKQGYFPNIPNDDQTFTEFDDYTGLQTNQTDLHVKLAWIVETFHSIDELSGTMEVSGTLFLSWLDERLAWNDTLAPFYTHDEKLVYLNKILIPSSWVWAPDIVLFNALPLELLGDLVSLYPNGLLVWEQRGTFITNCDLDLRLFPFDTQQCTYTFGSNLERVAGGIQLSNLNLVNQKFNSLFGTLSSAAWEYKGCTGDNFDLKVGGSKKSVVTYTLTEKRYTAFYWSTTLIPLILVVIISICSLWIRDYPTRLSLIITLMLTINAIQWSLTSSIPVTSTTNWIENLSQTCILFVASISVQSITSAVLSERKDEFPHRLLFILQLGKNVEKFFYWQKQTEPSATSVIEMLSDPEGNQEGIEKAYEERSMIKDSEVKSAREKWRKLSTIFDQVAHFIFLLLFVVMIVHYFSLVLYPSDRCCASPNPKSL